MNWVPHGWKSGPCLLGMYIESKFTVSKPRSSLKVMRLCLESLRENDCISLPVHSRNPCHSHQSLSKYNLITLIFQPQTEKKKAVLHFLSFDYHYYVGMDSNPLPTNIYSTVIFIPSDPKPPGSPQLIKTLKTLIPISGLVMQLLTKQQVTDMQTNVEKLIKYKERRSAAECWQTAESVTDYYY